MWAGVPLYPYTRRGNHTLFSISIHNVPQPPYKSGIVGWERDEASDGECKDGGGKGREELPSTTAGPDMGYGKSPHYNLRLEVWNNDYLALGTPTLNISERRGVNEQCFEKRR